MTGVEWLHCMSCGRGVDPASALALREVVGFAMPRKATLIERRETGRVMCPNCGVRLQRTGNPRQTDMLTALSEGPAIGPPSSSLQPITEWAWLA